MKSWDKLAQYDTQRRWPFNAGCTKQKADYTNIWIMVYCKNDLIVGQEMGQVNLIAL